ncbi:hypothetical protein OQA88_9047 [Cercophora sp. LCS_1]
MRVLPLLVLSTAGVNAIRGHPDTYHTTKYQPEGPYPSLAEIYAARDTAPSSSPTSNVQGVAFDRIVHIWLENIDYDDAANNQDMQWIANQGLLLTNYWAVTHPSQPNYAATVAGDYFGMDHDDLVAFPENISTIVDLLDTKHISWGEYQENMPYAGFQGMNFSNRETGASDYVRKHNPLMLFDSVALNETRRSQIKNFTAFYEDLRRERLPQWSFITPNMTNDAHDTNLTFSARWTRNFLTPLLQNPHFTRDTLIVLSFDESDRYDVQNRVFTVLLGDAIPPALRGKTDSTFYTHYSGISTVSFNWGLGSLGRWDCQAEPFALVRQKYERGYLRRDYGPQPGDGYNIDANLLWYNQSYAGPVSENMTTTLWPVPETRYECVGGPVLDSIKKVWGTDGGSYWYGSRLEPDGGLELEQEAGEERDARAWLAMCFGGRGRGSYVGNTCGERPTTKYFPVKRLVPTEERVWREWK